MRNTILLLLSFFVITISQAQINISININTNLERRAISPLIYGSNGQSVDEPENITARRLGGDRLTGYNWETNASNAGTDYLNESDNYLPYSLNVPYNMYSVPNICFKVFHDTSLAMHCYTILTLQMAGYVARDENGIVTSGEVAPSWRWRQVVNQKGSAFNLNPDTSGTYVYIDECMNNLINAYGLSSSPTGIKGYEMDNECSIWNGTHPLIHPLQPTISEMISKSRNLSRTIKTMDAGAEVYGPVDYGYNSFLNFQSAPDWGNYSSYGNFVCAYLHNMKLASDTFGSRLLDVLDEHWYPEAQGLDSSGNLERVSGGGNDKGVSIARMECPRTLWDSSYVENSWIGQYYSPVAFIPALQHGINTYYPGTKIAFTEFDYGGEDHISGGIANADVFGIFGKYGVYMSSHWGPLYGYVAAAYKIYRNYDGKNSTFGDVHVEATTNDYTNSSVYASIESTDTTVMHIIVMNKNYDSTLVSTFNISANTTFNTAEAWAFYADTPTIKNMGSVAIANNKFSFSVPPLTVYHFVLKNTVATGVASVAHESFEIFPNPAVGVLNISTVMNNFTVVITDLSGRELFSGKNVRQADISNLSRGMFFVRLVDGANNVAVTKAFVKD